MSKVNTARKEIKDLIETYKILVVSKGKICTEVNTKTQRARSEEQQRLTYPIPIPFHTRLSAPPIEQNQSYAVTKFLIVLSHSRRNCPYFPLQFRRLRTHLRRFGMNRGYRLCVGSASQISGRKKCENRVRNARNR